MRLARFAQHVSTVVMVFVSTWFACRRGVCERGDMGHHSRRRSALASSAVGRFQ
jgi:hypothetical protein